MDHTVDCQYRTCVVRSGTGSSPSGHLPILFIGRLPSTVSVHSLINTAYKALPLEVRMAIAKTIYSGLKKDTREVRALP